MQRREFLKAALALVGRPPREIAAGRLPSRAFQSAGRTATGAFPVTAQLSALPGRRDWHELPPAERAPALRAAIDEIIDHGFTAVECPLPVTAAETPAVLEYLRSRGMRVTYNRSFDKKGVEMFGRDKPAPISVFSPAYAEAVRRNVEAALAEAKAFTPLDYLLIYQDEPFHAGPESFDYGEDVTREFQRRYGYTMPPDLESARKFPRVWQDVLDFRSSEFRTGWRQAYRIIKEMDPAANVILTHDSHSTFGAGVGSNAKLAVDDVFHWGGDFADTFLFDVYPYMMFDFRYGEYGILREPRFSQMHYALGQMRNLAYTHGKAFGFWFGTFNKRWFKKFMGPELESLYWAERETSLTAVAHGANLLVSGYNLPESEPHWSSLGEGLRIIQRGGPELLAAPKKRAKACFLFPRTQYLQLQEEYWNVGLSYELFMRAFGELDVLHEDQVTDDRMGGYRILTLFDVRLLPDAVARRIASFVRAGGIVVADCVPNLDALGRQSAIMSELFGVRDAATTRIPRSGVWVPSLEQPHWFVPPRPEDGAVVTRDRVKGSAFNRAFDFSVASPRACTVTTGEVLLQSVSGRAALVRRRVGKGRAYLLGFCAQDRYFQTFKDRDEQSRDQLGALLAGVTEDAGVRAHVQSSTPEIEATLRMSSRAGYLFVINHGAKGPNTRVRLTGLDFNVARIVNLADQQPVAFERHDEGISLEIAVAPAEPRLLRMARDGG